MIRFDAEWCTPLMLTFAHLLWQGSAIALIARAAARSTTKAQHRHHIHLGALLLIAVCPLVTFGLLASATMAGAGTTGGGATHATLSTLMTAAYVVGAVLMLGRMSFGVVRGVYWRRCSEPIADVGVADRVDRMVDRLVRAFALRTRPAVAACRKITVPMVVGTIRPVILLPVWVLNDLPPDHVQAMLAHELAHVARRDMWVNLLQGVIEALLFFHPAVWWVSRQIREEREQCCDDLAVQVGTRGEAGRTDGKLVYARCLLRVAELAERDGQRITTTALAATDGAGSLRHRILRLLGERQTPSIGARLIGIAAALATACLAIAMMLAHEARADGAPSVQLRDSRTPSAQSEPQPVLAFTEWEALRRLERFDDSYGTGFSYETARLRRRAGRPHAAPLVTVVSVRLNNPRVGDMDLAPLARLTHLRRLDLTSTRVSDAGLSHLRNLTELRRLDLTNTRVTDAGLVHLSRMRRLVHVGLEGTRVTAGGMARLNRWHHVGARVRDGATVIPAVTTTPPARIGSDDAPTTAGRPAPRRAAAPAPRRIAVTVGTGSLGLHETSPARDGDGTDERAGGWVDPPDTDTPPTF